MTSLTEGLLQARLGSKISFSVIGNFNLASAVKQNHKKAISNGCPFPANLRLTLSFDSGKISQKLQKFFKLVGLPHQEST